MIREPFLALAWSQEDLIAPLLILVLGMALGMGLVCILLVAYSLRRRGRAIAPQPSPTSPHAEEAFVPGVIPLPDTWIAVRSDDPRRVQAAIGLLTPRPCSWEEGLAAAQDNKLFVSAPIRGWVLVMGAGLPDPFDDVDHCFRMTLALSRRLGPLQLFSLNRAVHHHAWVMASHGCIVRAYAWAGETLWNQGRPTRAERELRLRCFAYADQPELHLFSLNHTAATNTEKLPLLAARWSVDPAGIDPRRLHHAHGVAGKLPEIGAL